MTARIIDGKAISAKRRAARRRAGDRAQGRRASARVSRSSSWARTRRRRSTCATRSKACAETGIFSEKIELPATTTQDELLAVVEELNARDDIHGILVQFPLPAALDEDEVIETISIRQGRRRLPPREHRAAAGRQGHVRVVHARRRAWCCSRRAAST